MQPKKLEQYKYFQPIAWAVCIGFATFVGMMALEVKATMQEMESSTLSLEYRLKAVEQAIGVVPGE